MSFTQNCTSRKKYDMKVAHGTDFKVFSKMTFKKAFIPTVCTICWLYQMRKTRDFCTYNRWSDWFLRTIEQYSSTILYLVFTHRQHNAPCHFPILIFFGSFNHLLWSFLHLLWFIATISFLTLFITPIFVRLECPHNVSVLIASAKELNHICREQLKL